MAIPRTQLETWTNQGAVNNSKRTYRTIQNALESERSALSQHDIDWEIYLQGSYRNDTNIYGDSDVDIVVRLTSTWSFDLEELSDLDAEAYKDAYTEASYNQRDFYEDVRKSLYRYFNRGAIEKGGKALQVLSDKTNIPLDADVVACQEFRHLHYFNSKSDQNYTSGMHFKTRDWKKRAIVNYSQEHYEHGVQKNDETNGRYKQTVRMFKNARNKMRKEGIIPKGTAPSYYIEGLLYNVKSQYFKSNVKNRYDEIVSHLERQRDLNNLQHFQEQCEMYPLFDESEKDRWNQSDAVAFIDGARQLWDDW